MNGPYLSIITPVYQGAGHITRCIESVINQRCSNLEHIIIDGGSTDGTLDIIHKYAQDYRHIRFESDKDSGQSHAMNKGLRLARGKVIGLLNVDDYHEPGVLNRVISIFSALPEPSLLVGNCYVRDGNNRILRENKPCRLRQKDLLTGSFLNPFPLNPSAYFYSKSLHEEIGYYKEDDHFSMDVEFLLKAVTVAHVKYVDEFWGNFLYAEGTKTFEDVKSGGNHRRVQRLIELYIRELPFCKRIEVRVKRHIFSHHKVSYFYSRLCYYAADPRRIGGFFARRFMK